jgi:hypothetical protein
MDLFNTIKDITEAHNATLRTGLKHGEQLGFGKLVDRINQMADATGVATEYNRGFRAALFAMRAYILAEMKEPK